MKKFVLIFLLLFSKPVYSQVISQGSPGQNPWPVQTWFSGSAVDPRAIRVLTSGDIVTVVQPIGSNLHITVDSIPTHGVTGTFWQATQPVSIATMPTTPVTGTFWQATQPISAFSLPLPALAATSTLQTAGNNSLANIESSQSDIFTSVDNLASAVSVLGGEPDAGNALTVQGSDNMMPFTVVGNVSIPTRGVSGTITTATTCPGAGCVEMQLAGTAQSTALIEATGTWTGTLSFLGVGQSGTQIALSCEFSPSSISITLVPVQSTTGNGRWLCSAAGYETIRVLANPFSSGSANVYITVVLGSFISRSAHASWITDSTGATATIGANGGLKVEGVPGGVGLPVVQTTGSNLHMVCDSGCGGAAAFSDNSAFTAGTTGINIFGAVFNDGLSAVTSGNAATPRITAQRGIHFNMRTNAGVEVPFPAALGANGGFKIEGVASGIPVPVSFTVGNAPINLSQVAGVGILTGGVSGSQGVGGLSASGATKNGNPIQIGGVFNTTQPTVTTGLTVEAQMTARGAQIVATGIDGFPVTGASATGTAKSGNPVQSGAVFNTTQPTVTNGQVVENQATARGAQIVATGVDAFNATATGAVANGVAKSGNPVQTGAVYNTTQPVAGVSGIVLESQATARGAQIVAPGVEGFPVSIPSSSNSVINSSPRNIVSIAFSESVAAPVAASWYIKKLWSTIAISNPTDVVPSRAFAAVTTAAGSRTLIAVINPLATFNMNTNAFAEVNSVAPPLSYGRLFGCVNAGMAATADTITVVYNNHNTISHTTAGVVFPASTIQGVCFEFPLAGDPGGGTDIGATSVTNITDTAAPATGTLTVYGVTTLLESLGTTTLDSTLLDTGRLNTAQEQIAILLMQTLTTAQQRTAGVTLAIR